MLEKLVAQPGTKISFASHVAQPISMGSTILKVIAVKVEANLACSVLKYLTGRIVIMTSYTYTCRGVNPTEGMIIIRGFVQDHAVHLRGGAT